MKVFNQLLSKPFQNKTIILLHVGFALEVNTPLVRILKITREIAYHNTVISIYANSIKNILKG